MHRFGEPPALNATHRMGMMREASVRESRVLDQQNGADDADHEAEKHFRIHLLRRGGTRERTRSRRWRSDGAIVARVRSGRSTSTGACSTHSSSYTAASGARCACCTRAITVWSRRRGRSASRGSGSGLRRHRGVLHMNGQLTFKEQLVLGHSRSQFRTWMRQPRVPSSRWFGWMPEE